MVWKKYQSRRTGECHVDLRGRDIIAAFEMGVIETGRQRVFTGVYIKVIGEDGTEWIGEDDGAYIQALRALDDDIALDRGRLLCAGLHDGFYETGLSANSGYGYIDGYPEAVHMMERPRLLAKDEAGQSRPSPIAAILAEFRARVRDNL